jgi:hypothetical protein
LKTLEKRLQANYYSDKEVFVKDMLRVFANAKVYNLPETIYVKAANELEEFVAPYLAALKDDQTRSYERNASAEKVPQKGLGVKKRIKKDK